MHDRQWPVSTVRTDLLLRLPRELRDEIHADALKVPTSLKLPLALPLSQHVPPVLREDPNLLSEALEALYKVNTFVLKIPVSSLEEPLPTSVYAQSKNYIRHLVVKCTEQFRLPGHVDKDDKAYLQDYEEVTRCNRARRHWEQLLELPHLQDLTINMQKIHNDSLQVLNFGPILYALRAKKPELKITFNLSFDKMLKRYWDAPESPAEDPYKPMGYADMSDLVAPVTQEDLDYIHEYLPEYVRTWEMPFPPSIKNGLLDESPAGRRILARHYAIKEPALLRYRIQVQFDIYRKVQEEDA